MHLPEYCPSVFWSLWWVCFLDIVVPRTLKQLSLSWAEVQYSGLSLLHGEKMHPIIGLNDRMSTFFCLLQMRCYTSMHYHLTHVNRWSECIGYRKEIHLCRSTIMLCCTPQQTTYIPYARQFKPRLNIFYPIFHCAL